MTLFLINRSKTLVRLWDQDIVVVLGRSNYRSCKQESRSRVPLRLNVIFYYLPLNWVKAGGSWWKGGGDLTDVSRLPPWEGWVYFKPLCVRVQWFIWGYQSWHVLFGKGVRYVTGCVLCKTLTNSGWNRRSLYVFFCFLFLPFCFFSPVTEKCFEEDVSVWRWRLTSEVDSLPTPPHPLWVGTPEQLWSPSTGPSKTLDYTYPIPVYRTFAVDVPLPPSLSSSPSPSFSFSPSPLYSLPSSPSPLSLRVYSVPFRSDKWCVRGLCVLHVLHNVLGDLTRTYKPLSPLFGTSDAYFVCLFFVLCLSNPYPSQS